MDHVAPAAVMAVVKANAYGHGAIAVARTALAHGASNLAVYTVSEAVALRESGVRAPILIFGPFGRPEAAEIWLHGLTPTLTNLESAALLQDQAAGRSLRFHLKLDTGLSRAGIAPDEAVDFVRAVAHRFPALHLDGVYSHFAAADEENKTITLHQLERFRDAVARLLAEGFSCACLHVSNSAALLDVPDARFTMVRAGIAMYGYYPARGSSRAVDLVPALQLVSEVSRVHTVPADTGVGYGHEFRSIRPTTIALVPIGYGDGLPRTLGNSRGRVIVHSRLAPIVGRVSMDQITIDVTEINAVQLGDPVTLIGAQNGMVQSADELGSQAGTISYAILTGLLPRIPRVYVERGALVDVPSPEFEKERRADTVGPMGQTS